jgi:glycosyltransferase involved in cell wall biosynthesis
MENALRMKLTVIIPCYNEENNIRECLESVMWADEILVVDSFSTDKTLEIARDYTDRILQHKFVNDAVQKNWVIPQAQNNWVLIVDCDERVTPELRDEIINLLAQCPSKDGYWIKRRNYLMGKHVSHSGWGRDSVLRLFRKNEGRYEEKRVHGEIQLTNTGTLKSFFDHYTVSSIGEWVNKINRYSSYKAQDKYERGLKAPVVHMIIRPPVRFFKDYFLRLGLLDGWRGFLIAALSAFAELFMASKVIQITFENRRKQHEKLEERKFGNDIISADSHIA